MDCTAFMQQKKKEEGVKDLPCKGSYQPHIPDSALCYALAVFVGIMAFVMAGAYQLIQVAIWLIK